MCFIYEFWNMSSINFIIRFHFQKQIELRCRKSLKFYIARQLRKAGKERALINFIFCSDDALLEINQAYLAHDYYTDIITFDLSENRSFLLSDIYISVDRVKENAKTLKVPLATELHRVIFHGILHLIGYKDKTPKDQQEMKRMEENWINDY